MDIGEFIKKLNDTYPNWGLYTTAVAALVGYVIGRLHESFEVEEHTLDSTVIPVVSEEYRRRTISEATSLNTPSQISGIIMKFYYSLNGYSGIIQDASARAPFYIDEQNIEFYEKEGLVPILLEDALEKKGIVEMGVEFDDDTKVFNVEWLRYRMGNTDYEI